MPDAKDIVTGPVVSTTNFGVPLGSTAPFSVTLTTAPFVFPTVSPWFIIPRIMFNALNREFFLIFNHVGSDLTVKTIYILEEKHTFIPTFLSKNQPVFKISLFNFSVKSLKQRLIDCTEIAINLELDNNDIWTNTPAVESEPQLPPADVSDKNTQPRVQESAEMSNIVLADKEDVASATKAIPTTKDNVTETEFKIVETTEKTEAENKNVLSESTVSENQVVVSGKVHESAEKTTETGSKAVPEKKEEAETIKDNIQPQVGKDAKRSEPNETEKTDQIEVKGSAEAKEEVKPSNNQPLTKTALPAPHEPLTDAAQEPQTTLKTQETTVKAPSEVHQSRNPDPDHSVAEQKTRTNASEKQQHTAGTSGSFG
ncbi:hypothetical protein GOODEAATRI_003509 [Goodea atripinnis]|uniref:Uncharacterized protein n=1 Tax=Goodea atripinnis TaxID=208336 RepID=A0ABV0PV10_9TELE